MQHQGERGGGSSRCRVSDTIPRVREGGGGGEDDNDGAGEEGEAGENSDAGEAGPKPQ